MEGESPHLWKGHTVLAAPAFSHTRGQSRSRKAYSQTRPGAPAYRRKPTTNRSTLRSARRPWLAGGVHAQRPDFRAALLVVGSRGFRGMLIMLRVAVAFLLLVLPVLMPWPAH